MRGLSRCIVKVLVIAVLCVPAAGCYERVVRTKGVSAKKRDVYEANTPDQRDKLDELMWGTSGSDKK